MGWDSRTSCLLVDLCTPPSSAAGRVYGVRPAGRIDIEYNPARYNDTSARPHPAPPPRASPTGTTDHLYKAVPIAAFRDLTLSRHNETELLLNGGDACKPRREVWARRRGRVGAGGGPSPRAGPRLGYRGRPAACRRHVAPSAAISVSARPADRDHCPQRPLPARRHIV